MPIRIRLDFDNRYEIEPLKDNLRVSVFETELKDGSLLPLMVKVSDIAHELLPSVFNMAFGPLKGKGGIDDKAEIPHKNYSRAFSTILVAGLFYLRENKDHFLGIDGSTNGRAYLYYRLIQQNFDYLDKYFNIYGLKYYVRITRFGKLQYDNPFDFEDVYPIPDQLYKGMVIPPDLMYNYFIFNLK
jgi:hypothetical protein